MAECPAFPEIPKEESRPRPWAALTSSKPPGFYEVYSQGPAEDSLALRASSKLVASTSLASYLKGFPLKVWGTCKPPSAPQSQSRLPSGPYLRALALVDEEDSGERIREPSAVSGKEASGLIHVGSELEGLLLCGEERAKPCHMALWSPGSLSWESSPPRMRRPHSLV